MSLKNDAKAGYRFLKEALPLISSYFSGESVQLAGAEVAVGEQEDDEGTLFTAHIKFRHAIACCARLVPIIQRIEGRVSTFTETDRLETKGVMRGRLDIPRYVSRRASSLSWPKSYPILVTVEVPSTPENALIVRVCRTLIQRLSCRSIRSNSAEAILGQRYRTWLMGRMKRDPWAEVKFGASLQRLYLEAARRVARRQTGNEAAYTLSLIHISTIIDELLR